MANKILIEKLQTKLKDAKKFVGIIEFEPVTTVLHFLRCNTNSIIHPLVAAGCPI